MNSKLYLLHKMRRIFAALTRLMQNPDLKRSEEHPTHSFALKRSEEHPTHRFPLKQQQRFGESSPVSLTGQRGSTGHQRQIYTQNNKIGNLLESKFFFFFFFFFPSPSFLFFPSSWNRATTSYITVWISDLRPRSLPCFRPQTGNHYENRCRGCRCFVYHATLELG